MDMESATSAPPSSSRLLRPDAFLLYGFLGWALLLGLQLGRLMLVEGPERLRQMRAAAVETYQVPGRRGTIYDYQGNPVAWSESRFDLVWKASASSLPLEVEWERLEQALKEAEIPCPPRPALDTPRVLVKSGLTPSQCLRLRPILPRFSALEISGRYCRMHRAAVPGRLDLGETAETREGLEVGVSGLEKEFDDQLAPRLARVSVMKDKSDRWILSSYQEQSGLANGGDVFLPMSLGAP